MSLDRLLAALREPPEVLARLRAIPRLFVVGGWLRDAYYGKPSRDIDLAVAPPLDEALPAIARALDARPIELSERFSSYRFISSDLSVDVSPLQGGSLEADLSRRDYTVNALGLPLSCLGGAVARADILSHAQSFDDLQSRTLRMLSADNLADDPARLLRGYRLAACEELIPEAQTRSAWARLAPGVLDSAPERLHEELVRWFGAPSGLAGTLRACAEDGVLWQLFPPLKQMAGCEQNGFHHLDVWEHTLEALQHLEALRRELPAELAQWESELTVAWQAPIGGLASAGALTALALLLHDIGKPDTREAAADGHLSFYGHQELGAQLAAPLLEALRFAQVELDFVLLLIREHLRLGFYSDTHPLPPKLTFRFVRRLGPATPLAVLHSLADCAAARGPLSEGGVARHLAAAAEILSHYYAADQVARPPLLLDGHAIMQLLGLKPGPLVGRLKEALLEGTAAGEVQDPPQAEDYVRQAYQQMLREAPADSCPPTVD